MTDTVKEKRCGGKKAHPCIGLENEASKEE